MKILKYYQPNVFYELYCSGVFILFDEVREGRALRGDTNNITLLHEDTEVAVIMQEHITEFKLALESA